MADLPSSACQLAEMLPRQHMHARALAFLESRLNEPWAIACSGGADSLALLMLIWGYWPQHRSALTVLHYNHALRGEASEADSAFVTQVAQTLNIPCIQARAQNSSSTSKYSEESLREARYAFMESAMEKLGAHVLLLGHQADDVAETFCMRMARGSGLAGLIVPRPITQVGTIWRVRPLINIPKTELKKALESAGQSWREDASNAGDQFLRNRVRQSVLPALEAALGPQWLAGAGASRELLEEDASALDHWATTLMSHYHKGQPLDWRPIAWAPRAVQRRVLYRWLTDVGLILEKRTFEAILTHLAANEPGCWNVATQRQLEFSNGQVCLVDDPDEVTLWASAQAPLQTLELGKSLQLSDGAILEAHLHNPEDPDPSITPDLYVALIAIPAETSSLSIRFWRPGDRYQPQGFAVAKKLQDIFTDAKVPKLLRHSLPLVVDAQDEILWIPGLRTSEKTREQAGFRPWKLTYRPSP